jgi:acetyl esterase/lipase
MFNRSTWFGFVAVTAVLLAPVAQAQMTPEMAEKIKVIGRVVNPPATAPLYASRVIESEPYAGVSVQRDIKYGDDPRHLLDVFTPQAASAAPRPVFVFVHGGGFVRGDRRGPGSPFYDTLMLWAVRNGMIGVNMTYRLAPKDLWPAGAQDVGLAIRWVNEQVAARGGDPKKVFLMGHSAGAAHVASYVADERFHQVPGSGLAGALMLSGLFQITPDLTAQEAPVMLYFGADAANYAERSAQNGLVRSKVPLWVGYSELNPPGFVVQSEGLNDALCKAGRCPSFHRFAGHSHMSEIYSIHTDDKVVSDAMFAFVKAR